MAPHEEKTLIDVCIAIDSPEYVYSDTISNVSGMNSNIRVKNVHDSDFG